MKKNQLQRELMMSGEGFVKQLSLNEFYKESLVWKQVERIGRQLTSNWPKDSAGKDFWDSTYYLRETRYACIKFILCKTDEELEELFDDSLISVLNIKVGIMHFVALKLLLTWVALKFIKNPSKQVRRYLRYLRNFSFSKDPSMIQYFIDNNMQDKYTNIYNPLLTIEEELQVRYWYKWIYDNIESLSPYINNCKREGVCLKITPELAKPKNIYGGWWKATNSFDLSRIGDILDFWEDSADKIIVAKDILDNYEYSSIDNKEEKEEKILFLNSLIQHMKRNTTINLLCRLKKENMEATGIISTLSTENKNLVYQKKDMEEENMKLKEAFNEKGAVLIKVHNQESGSIYNDYRQEMNVYNNTPDKSKE